MNDNVPTPNGRPILNVPPPEVSPGVFELQTPPDDCVGLQQLVSVPVMVGGGPPRPGHRPDALVRLLGDGWTVAAVTSEQVTGPPPPMAQLLPGRRLHRVAVILLAYHLTRTAPAGTPPAHLVLLLD